ncbi:ABC transporter ATP-binding protein [Paenibacillus silvae]|uniref:ABC transporter ATP-binding protein n=1 Tax=Paenibacillus silvae TaxID=1325358 RepID=UPI0020053F5C|nr:dipeptide/oligopeptide/nickel ABC transporter ATP-binding protein [Paenibacillus silvae]MCK6077743.1 dipeptide/oligopeptide/nickel ABC transporter ATP-binding protein [Paenibacillus silvae]MCK6151942.1 dipeptide/oligopeptide/nickel ABC transporter ATP-binding protein [Paenibacillus silvae]MCK6270627.1 dipeptide/oligopeptide/nickel ABC transporter ATP-binding protein [Paenibacillus silvae]
MTDNRGPILKLNQVCKTYDLKGQQSVQALQNINLALYPGECLGIVGQSGSGKSSLAKCVTQLEQVTSGEIWYRQQEITRLKGEKLRQMRKQIQMVFQEPAAIFNPRMKVGRFICEPLLNYKMMKREQAFQEMLVLLERVGLSAADADKYPHELSGGQQQRAVIARAIGLRPDVILYDEATSALDVSIQQQILDLLIELRRETGGSSIFISHDLAVVQQVSDRIAVMHEGKVVEIVDSSKLTSSANHGYTRGLMSSALSLRALRDSRQMQERIEVVAGSR